MLYRKQLVQETVCENDISEFDRKMNDIFKRIGTDNAEIHYFDNLGLCATVRYYTEKHIPETISIIGSLSIMDALSIIGL